MRCSPSGKSFAVSLVLKIAREAKIKFEGLNSKHAVSRRRT